MPSIPHVGELTAKTELLKSISPYYPSKKYKSIKMENNTTTRLNSRI